MSEQRPQRQVRVDGVDVLGFLGFVTLVAGLWLAFGLAAMLMVAGAIVFVGALVAAFERAERLRDGDS